MTNVAEILQRRIGDNTMYAATLICKRSRDDAYNFEGSIRFDDNTYNIPYDTYLYTLYNDWWYSDQSPIDTDMLEKLSKWHSEIVRMFERVKAERP